MLLRDVLHILADFEKNYKRDIFKRIKYISFGLPLN